MIKAITFRNFLEIKFTGRWLEESWLTAALKLSECRRFLITNSIATDMNVTVEYQRLHIYDKKTKNWLLPPKKSSANIYLRGSEEDYFGPFELDSSAIIWVFKDQKSGQFQCRRLYAKGMLDPDLPLDPLGLHDYKTIMHEFEFI